MKLAFSTLACHDMTLAQAIELARDAGYQGIDLRTFGHDSRRFLPEPCLTGSQKLRELCDDAGVRAMCLSTSIRYDEPIFPPIAGRILGGTHASVLRSKEMIHVAAKAEIPHVRVFGYEFSQNEDWKHGLRRIVERLDLAARTARHTGVRIVVENGGSFSTAEHILRLLDAVDNALLAVAYSPAVALAAGEDPAEGMRLLGDRLAIVKLKDLRDGRPVPIGEGNVGIESFAHAVRDLRQMPWVVYEYDRTWMPELPEPAGELRRAAELLYAWLARPVAARR